MKNKKILMYIGIILFILIITGTGYLIYININNKDKEMSKDITEFTPEEELSDTSLRKTVLSLYFIHSNNGKLKEESRQIDSKELLKNPYLTLMELLIKGPNNNEELVGLIPENTKINSAERKGNTVYLDLSKEFVKDQNLGKEQEELIINSIVKTMTELTEVNFVVFLIDGKKDMGFPDEGIMFNKPFTR